MTPTIPTAETRRVMLTVAEAADELAVTERFIRKLISTGQFRAVKVGTRVVHVRRADLEDLFAAGPGGAATRSALSICR